MQLDLLGWSESDDRYPNRPGFKNRDTSKAAADAMRPRAGTLRAAALKILSTAPRTADEVAAQLGESILSIRPRITELSRLGYVIATKERRANQSTHKAIVWTITPIGKSAVA